MLQSAELRGAAIVVVVIMVFRSKSDSYCQQGADPAKLERRRQIEPHSQLPNRANRQKTREKAKNATVQPVSKTSIDFECLTPFGAFLQPPAPPENAVPPLARRVPMR
jgi:hypothetical protein